jgi:hypothetical protein
MMQIEEVVEVWEGTTSGVSQLGSGFFFGGKKSPKGDTAQTFWWKSSLFLKSIHQIVPLLKEQVVTSMPTGYIFNAPREKYG